MRAGALRERAPPAVRRCSTTTGAGGTGRSGGEHTLLQARIARELRLKRTPTLQFSYDDTTDRAMRVDALIDEIGQS